MPAFTLPPDTRAVGQGNPPADMNSVVDALTAALTVNAANAAYSGGMDPSFTAAQNTTAFQAAVTAATSVSGATPARTVFIPAGAYSLNALPAIAGPVRITGEGQAFTAGATLAGGTTLNVSGQGFTFPYQGYLWSGLEVGNLAISYTGTGDVFHNMNFKAGWFHDLGITITGTGSAAFTSTGTASVLNHEHERVSITTTNATRTVPMVSLSSTGPGSVSNNTFWKCYFNNAGFDNTQPCVYIDCAGGANAYHYMETFRDCWFESCYGGAVKSLSGIALLIDGCTVWDIFTGSGGTVGNSCYYIGAYPSTGPGSQQTRILGCSRNQNGPNGSTTWDVYCEATTCGTVIEGCSVKPDTASTATNFYVNLNAHPDAQLIGNTSPRGATVNGNSNTVISNPAYSTYVLGGGASGSGIALEVGSASAWTPPDAGFLAWNYDPGLLLSSTTGNTLANNTVTLIRITLRRAISVTNVALFLTAVGTSLTTSQNLAGLYNSSGTVIGTTADQTTSWGTGAPKLVQMALTGGPYPLQAGFYWVAAVTNGTGTPPAFARAVNTASTQTNMGLTAASYRFATNGTATTSLPSITPSANSGDGHSWWAALS